MGAVTSPGLYLHPGMGFCATLTGAWVGSNRLSCVCSLFRIGLER